MKEVRAVTLEIRKDVISKLISGMTFKECCEYLQGHYGYKKRGADKFVRETNKQLREHYEKYAKNLAAYNLSRLTEIVNDCQAEGKYNEALKAIDILNKMGGLYTKKVEIKTEEPIEISFN